MLVLKWTAKILQLIFQSLFNFSSDKMSAVLRKSEKSSSMMFKYAYCKCSRNSRRYRQIESLCHFCCCPQYGASFVDISINFVENMMSTAYLTFRSSSTDTGYITRQSCWRRAKVQLLEERRKELATDKDRVPYHLHYNLSHALDPENLFLMVQAMGSFRNSKFECSLLHITTSNKSGKGLVTNLLLSSSMYVARSRSPSFSHPLR